MCAVIGSRTGRNERANKPCSRRGSGQARQPLPCACGLAASSGSAGGGPGLSQAASWVASRVYHGQPPSSRSHGAEIDPTPRMSEGSPLLTVQAELVRLSISSTTPRVCHLSPPLNYRQTFDDRSQACYNTLARTYSRKNEARRASSRCNRGACWPSPPSALPVLSGSSAGSTVAMGCQP
jgi:hypothetical protein